MMIAIIVMGDSFFSQTFHGRMPSAGDWKSKGCELHVIETRMFTVTPARVDDRSAGKRRNGAVSWQMVSKW